LQHPGEDRDGVKNKAVPVSGIGIGPVSKFDVMRCGVMLEREREWVKMCEKEYAVRPVLSTHDHIAFPPHCRFFFSRDTSAHIVTRGRRRRLESG
jgi:hypothetical protein